MAGRAARDACGEPGLLGDLLAERLPEVVYDAPEASFLAWLDCRALGLGDDPAATFLEHGRVASAAGWTSARRAPASRG